MILKENEWRDGPRSERYVMFLERKKKFYHRIADPNRDEEKGDSRSKKTKSTKSACYYEYDSK